MNVWYAAGLEHHAEELEQTARLARLRAKRLAEPYRGECLTVFSEAMAAAAAELRKAAGQLRYDAKEKEPEPKPPAPEPGKES